jgi:hypothetical protein
MNQLVPRRDESNAASRASERSLRRMFDPYPKITCPNGTTRGSQCIASSANAR